MQEYVDPDQQERNFPDIPFLQSWVCTRLISTKYDFSIRLTAHGTTQLIAAMNFLKKTEVKLPNLYARAGSIAIGVE